MTHSPSALAAAIPYIMLTAFPLFALTFFQAPAIFLLLYCFLLLSIFL